MVFDETADVYRAWREYERGSQSLDFPVTLPVDRLPRNATTLRAAAEKIALIMGLRVSIGHDGAAPISRSFLALLMGWDPDLDKKRASRTLHALERYRVIRQDGTLDKRGPLDASRCFQPFGYDLATLAAGEITAARDVDVFDASGEFFDELSGLDPLVEVADQKMVRETDVAREVCSVGMVASGDRAGAIGHTYKSRARTG